MLPVRFQRNGVIVWSIAAIVILIMGYPLAALIAFGLVVMYGAIWWFQVHHRNSGSPG